MAYIVKNRLTWLTLGLSAKVRNAAATSEDAGVKALHKTAKELVKGEHRARIQAWRFANGVKLKGINGLIFAKQV